LCEGIASQSLNMYPCFACGPDNIAVLRRAAIAMSHEILQFHTRENGSSLDNSKALALLFFTARGPSSKQHLMRPQSPLLVICTYGSRHTARAINAHWEYVPAVARSGEEAQRLCNHASIGRLTIARRWHCSLHRPRSILRAALDASSVTPPRNLYIRESAHCESDQCTLGICPSGGALWGGGPETLQPR
jgi:hypothetical protein